MKRVLAVLITTLTLGATACRKPAPEPTAPSPSSLPSESSAKTSENPVDEEPAGETLARIHFIGTRSLMADTNAVTLRRIGELPESTALKEMLLGKLATAPGRAHGLATNITAETASAIRPLLNDALESETFLEARANEGSRPEWTLAVSLSAERAAKWDAGIKQALAKAGLTEPKPIEIGEARGWEIAGADGSGTTRFLALEGWALFGVGAAAKDASLQAEMAARIGVSGKPAPSGEEDALEVTIDFPRLVEEFGWTRWAGLPYVDIQSRIEDDNVRSTGNLVFADKLNLKAGGWKIPKKTIHDPLISFTAARGVATWLEKQPFYQSVKLRETPDQLFAWAMNGPFYLSFAAVPAKDSTAQIKELGKQLEKISRDELAKRGMGSITNIAATSTIQWVNAIPIARPNLAVSEETDDSFIQFSLLPIQRGSFTNAPPEGLLKLVEDRKDLVYYDWEITQARLGQLKLIFQLATLFSETPKMAANLATDKWITAVEKSLGNTATELTQANPRELNLVRRSHLGLSAFEIMTLGYWIGGKDFPLSRAKLPFLPLRKGIGGPAMPGVPAAPPVPRAKPDAPKPNATAPAPKAPRATAPLAPNAPAPTKRQPL